MIDRTSDHPITNSKWNNPEFVKHRKEFTLRGVLISEGRGELVAKYVAAYQRRTQTSSACRSCRRHTSRPS